MSAGQRCLVFAKAAQAPSARKGGAPNHAGHDPAHAKNVPRKHATATGAEYLTTYLNPRVRTLEICGQIVGNQPFYDLRLIEAP